MEADLSRQLHDLAAQALTRWGLPGAKLRLIAYRENAVFDVTAGQRSALRLHRQGYMTPEALRSELGWLQALAQAGVPVPLPLPTPEGDLLVTLHGKRHASMLSWVDGVPLGQSKQPLAWPKGILPQMFEALGRGMAELHNVSDLWPRPASFQRHEWDADALLGEAPFWGRFWDAPQLDKAEARALSALRDRLAVALEQARGLDYGLIHADLIRENVMVHGGEVRFIDFDDAGFGWRLFDLATALLPNLAEPDAPLIARHLTQGYQSRRPLPGGELLPLFLTLRALTYVGWFASRPEVDPSGERIRFHIARSLYLAECWHTGRSPIGGAI